MPRAIVALLTCLSLAACEQAPRSPAPTASAPAAATPAAPSPATPETPDTVPAAFLGVWDYEKGSCNPASDLRIEIGPKAVEFYEARGEITGVTVESPAAIVLSLAMAGEGETWTMRTRYTLTDDGLRLIPTSADGEDRGEPMPLTRCPR